MNAPINNMGSLAISSQNLDALQLQARQSPSQALKAAAQQFESVFMNMMLKSMRDATPQDGMFDNEQTKMFTSMLDQQLAQNMSAKGVGLADLMVKQLGRNLTQPGAVQGRAGLDNATQNAAPFVAPSTGIGAPSSTHLSPQQQAFLQRMMPAAMQASDKSGIPVQMMLGQAALESGWGQHEIRTSDGSSSFNLFGIKAGSNWNGKVVEVTTTEYRSGTPYKQVERFRAYDSYEQAFNDYAGLLTGNSRYGGVIQQAGNAEGFANAMQQAGYATDPHYAVKLAQVIGKVNELA
jgi:flagellar protein FlgJ